MCILKALAAGNSQATAAGIAGCCKSNVTYWKNKLVSMGALRLQCRSASQIFSLTPYGSKIVTVSENGFLGPVVGLEDYAVKFGVVENERVRIDWRKLGSPRNWEKLGVKVGNVRVIRTSRHLIIHPGKIRGFDMTECKVEAGRVIEATREVLENRFGMVLTTDFVPLRKPVFEFFTPEAEELAKHGSYTVKDLNGETIGSVNKSPPGDRAHVEYPEPEANRYILQPRILQRLETKVDTLIESNRVLADSVGKLVDFFQHLTEQPSSEPEKFSVPSYVR